MSIVERAADKLRQKNPQTVPSAHFAAVPDAPGRDHVAVAGRRETEQTPAKPRPLLAIDFAKLHRAGMVAPVSTQAMVAREYQRIKRPLLANTTAADPSGIANANRFMVASAIRGEGKTFTSVNLALSLAKERDYSVVLIDGDVIKPAISRAFGLEKTRGLTDILADDAISFSNTVVETNVPRLSILPAGQRHEEATELLASQRMAWFMSELSQDPNRMIVFDSPPLLATSEAQALAMAVGQIVLVVKAASTERAAVDAAVSLVAAPDRRISIILNQSRKAHGDYYAGYYGGYYGAEIGT